MNVTRVTPSVTYHTNVGANPATSGNTTLVAGSTGAKYRVLQVAIVTTLSNAVKFQSNTTDISATFPLGANGGIVLPFNEHGWFETNAGEALNVNLGSSTATGVQIQYVRMLA